MSPVLENIADSLLPQLEGVTLHEKWLECSRKYPWYPLSWLMLADPGNKESLDKAALWFNDEQRLHWLMHSKPITEDKWLAEQLQETERSRPEPEPKFSAAVPLIKKEDDNSTIIEDNVATDQLPEPGLSKPEPEPTIGTAIPIINKEEKETIIDENWLAEQLRQLDRAKTEPLVEPVPAGQPVVSPPADPGVESSTTEMPLASTTAQEPSKLEPSVIPGLRPQTQPATNAEPLLFEPYHAVDYFASQGIKLDLAGIPKDKLEKQLKSFTQWLKTMKKVNTEPAAYADPVVEAQAVESNTGKEVVTEAMAQVLEKQDKFDKAITIYEKLILLHPEKGALFAARIEDLKKKQ